MLLDETDFVVKNEPFAGNCWEAFTVTFVFVPGSRPHAFLTPRFCKDRLDQQGRPPGEGDLEFTVKQLSDAAAASAQELPAEIRKHFLGPEQDWPSTKYREEQARLARTKLWDRNELYDMLVAGRSLADHFGGCNYRNARILASILRLNPKEERVAYLGGMKDAQLRAEVVGLLKANNVETE